jgi:hypothetical protein
MFLILVVLISDKYIGGFIRTLAPIINIWIDN